MRSARRPLGAALVLCWALRPALAGAGGLESDVRRLISEHGFEPASVAVAVISDRGEMVVSLNEAEPFKPASNQKVLTVAAALHWLGPDHRYVTQILGSSPMQQGRIAGDIILRGSGDPNISGRFYDGDPSALLRSWARALRQKGLREVEGDVVADDGFFRDPGFPASWDRRQQEAWYTAQVSALSINDNCADVTVRPAAAAGRPARVEIVPACGALVVEGAPETVAGGAARVLVHRKPGTNRILVSGRIGVRSAPWTGNVTVDEPALVFASAFERALRDAGVAVGGRVRRLEARSTAAPPAKELSSLAPRPGEDLLIEHTSTLRQDLPIILKHSQNLHAEILLRVLGARAGGEGSLRGGDRAIRAFLKAKGIPAAGLAVLDGSGLAHENRVTAGLLARVLHSVRSQRHFEAFRDALPVGGKDGTLDDRFRSSPVRGSVYAKTGYIRGVSCLSGYVVKGERVSSFSVLVNDLRGGAAPAKRLQERIAERVHEGM